MMTTLLYIICCHKQHTYDFGTSVGTCFYDIKAKKINHKFLGHCLIAFSDAAFVILFSELKKNMTILPHH